MIKTFFGAGTLDTPWAFLTAAIIGLFFGFILERAGFGSSRRLTGVFYFTDMAVLQVMFSALLTAMLGLSLARVFGLISLDELYLMPTVYGAQIVGGLIFGVGFVMGGWCPGTAAVGAASGKLDALVFLGGAVLGSIIFNEVFLLIQPLYTWGQRGVVFVYQSLHLSLGSFTLLLTLVAVAAFWWTDLLGQPESAKYRQVLTYFSGAAVGLAALILVVSRFPGPSLALLPQEQELLARVEAAADHLEPEELADRLLNRDPGLLLVDLRPPGEYHTYHIPGAVNLPLKTLAHDLAPHRHKELIVLYSNGMTHPAQARDSLQRQGYHNVYILTDGLQGFLNRCLKPASLRDEPLDPALTPRITAWRRHFASP
jgi:thiosulfate/3-mercaptopyruvate sulfurtransferase